MLTVKHIDGLGNEALWAAANVRAFRSGGNTRGIEEPISKVQFDLLSGGHHSITQSGTVFIMNEHGKTVAKYSMDRFPETFKSEFGHAREVGAMVAAN